MVVVSGFSFWSVAVTDEFSILGFSVPTGVVVLP